MTLDRKKIAWFAVYIIIIAIVYNKWLFHFGIIAHGDWTFLYPEEMIDKTKNALSLWDSTTTLGRPAIDIGYSLSDGLYGILHYLTQSSYAIIERLVHIYPIIILTPLSAYIFLKSFIKNQAAIFSGVMVYCFNTYFLILQTGHLRLMAAFALAPLAFSSYIKIFKEYSTTKVIQASLLLALTSFYEPRVTYIMFWLIILYLCFTVFLEKNWKKGTELRKKIIFGISPFILTTLLMAYWLLGVLATGEFKENSVLATSLFGNEFMNIQQSFTLFHPFWTGEKIAEFKTQPIPSYFWIIPVITVMGFYLNRRKKIFTFFIILALLGIFLTKQIGEPFPNVYPWLHQHLIGFNAFRESSKFYFIIALSYSVLIAGCLDWLWKNKKISKLFIKIPTTVAISFLFLINTLPILTGELNPIFEQKTVPKDYQIVKDFAVKQKEYFRILWLPETSIWSINTINHPALDYQYVTENDWKNQLNRNEDHFKILLKKYSVKYIVIDANGENILPENLSGLEQLDLGTEQISIYQNQNYQPHIYMTYEKEILEQEIPWEKISFTPKNNNEFIMEIPDYPPKKFIHLTDQFRPQWQMYTGTITWYEKIFGIDKQKQISTSEKNDIGSNSFTVNSTSDQNNDASKKKLLFTIYYTPQMYINRGLIISGITVTLCLFILCGKWLRCRKKA